VGAELVQVERNRDVPTHDVFKVLQRMAEHRQSLIFGAAITLLHGRAVRVERDAIG
jgi:hypothetical protein